MQHRPDPPPQPSERATGRNRAERSWENHDVRRRVGSFRDDRPKVIDGAMNGVLFVAHIEQVPLPTNWRGDIVVMDKLSARKRTIDGLCEFLGQALDAFAPREL